MEINKDQEQSNINLKNKNNSNNFQSQNKILRSRSKNIHPTKKVVKTKVIPNAYAKPKILQNKNNSINNKQVLNKISISNNNGINKQTQKIRNDEKKNNKFDLNELNRLKEENLLLQIKSNSQDEILKELHNLFIHNYNKINSLKKKYSHLKRYLQKTLSEEDDNNLIKERIEEESALNAVEQQILDELCPNPDKMSYEQLLQLEEEVGIVNKGLSKDIISKIPLKPFHKALYEDNSDCIICMEGFSENELVKQLICGHIFHGDCIDHWLSQQKNCPFCKAECTNIY